MDKNITNQPGWLSSKEMKELLNISGCELMHRRERGDFEFKKVGNSYLYRKPKEINI